MAGGRGLVGSATLQMLKTRGYAHVLAPTREELDLMDAAAVARFFAEQKPEYVIMAAGRTGGIKATSAYPAEFLYENMVMQNNIIWRAHLSGAKKLLFLGSSCVYPKESSQPIKEEYLLTGPLEPANEGFALAKIAGLRLCEYISRQFEKEFISCMPCNLYGVGDSFDANRSNVLSSLLLRMHEAKKSNALEVSVWGTGNARRECLYVDDLVEALLFLMENYHGKEFLNVGSGEDISIRDLATLIKKVVGYEGALVFDPSKPEGAKQKLLDISRIKALCWQPRTSLEEGLKKTYAYFLSTRS